MSGMADIYPFLVFVPVIGLRKARAIGLGSAAVGSLVWGANASPIKK